MIKLMVSVLALTGIVAASIDTFSLFIDAPSIIIVTVFGFWYAASGTYSNAERIRDFSRGAVLGGWLGAIIGAVQMLGMGGEALFESPRLSSALLILILTLFWGYWIKGRTFILAENLPRKQP